MNKNSTYDQQNKQLIEQNLPCSNEDCGSSDALALYADGHTYCFSCKKYTPPSQESQNKLTASKAIEEKTEDTPVHSGVVSNEGEIKALHHRAIDYNTCADFGYKTHNAIEIASYYDSNGVIVAQKLRAKGKRFKWIGNPRSATLFGQQLWAGSSRERVIITEGEIDALSIYQATRGVQPVVSISNGAQSAKKDVQRNFEFLNSFKTIIVCFDNDEYGRSAAKEVAKLFELGKVRICTLPQKDANDMLRKNLIGDLIEALQNAKAYEPGGLVMGQSLVDIALTDSPKSDENYPWTLLNEMTKGIRYGTLITITAGIGMGKTSLLTELAYYLNRNNHKIGMLMLEEPLRVTTQRLVGHHLNVPLHLSQEGIAPETLKEAANEILNKDDGIILYDNQGLIDMESLFEKLAYMVSVKGVRFIFLDNLTVLAAGFSERDERRATDQAVHRLYAWARKENIVIFLAVHLRRIDSNKGHEEGAQIGLSHIRGTQGIGSNSDLVIGLERDQQGAEDNVSTIRILKNRWTGETGTAGELHYCKSTGRMTEIEPIQGTKKPKNSYSSPFVSTGEIPLNSPADF